MNSDTAIEVSVVLPCLNEADTLGSCIATVRRILQEQRLRGEIIVADNGSTNGSAAIAGRLGARVVPVPERGYGRALMEGIAAARGRFIIIGDADESYDFSEIPRFVARLRDGFELVQGCRLPAGGGRILPGAMPFLHRRCGNPLFTALARRWFKTPVHDVYCGLRGFTKDLYLRLNQRCTGMEFAPEMIIKASLAGARIGEVPITLHPDRRPTHRSHLKTFRDGWRTLRFFLIYSPRRLFLGPGALLVLLGLIGYALALPGVRIGRISFEAETLLFASLALLCGYQALLFALFTKTFALSEGMLPADPTLKRFFELVNLEKGLIAGLAALLGGVVLLLAVVYQWWQVDFGHLDYNRSMRWAVPGFTLVALGLQTVLASFFVSILGMHRR